MNTFLRDGVLITDNSDLEHLCEREYYYAVVLRKQARGDNRAALNAGSAIHAALDLHYRGETDLEVLEGAIVKHLPPVVGEWRTPALLIETLHRYLEHWRGKDFIPYTTPEQTFVELPFSVPLGEIEVLNEFYHNEVKYVKGQIIPIIYTGRFDLIERNGKEFWVVDHKTASMTGDSYWTHFELAQQTIGYVWAVRQCLPQLNVVGAKLNAIVTRRPVENPKPNSKAKTFEFDRRTFRYSPEHVDEWHRDVLHQCGTIIHHLQTGYWPKRTMCCVKARAYGTCQFAPICKTLPSHRADAESIYLEDNHWSPLD